LRIERSPALLLVPLALLTGASVYARQQVKPKLPSPGSCRVHRTTSPIQVDGLLDDQSWRHAGKVQLTYEVQPGENIPPRVRTGALIAHDDRNLDVAFHAYDPEPAKIRAHSKDRNQPFRDDFFGLILDTFNDKCRGYEFFVNAVGSQADLSRHEVTFRNTQDET
jgi:hypothetical protein